MTPDQLQQRLRTLAPDALVTVVDLTGTQDHYQVTIISKAFEGLLPLERQRRVMNLVKSEIDSGELHAFTMKTLTPS